jgi:hypothetical protein
MLGFLAFVWHSGARGYLYPQTTTSFLTYLVKQLLVLGPTSLASKLLQDSVLTTLVTVEGSRNDPAFGDVHILCEDELIWRFSLRSGSANLSVACEFGGTLSLSSRANTVLQLLLLITCKRRNGYVIPYTAQKLGITSVMFSYLYYLTTFSEMMNR